MNKGVAALPAVLIITLVIVEISITVAFLSFYLNQGVGELSMSNGALYFAESGAYDAILNIQRDLNFEEVSSTISFGSGKEAEVTVQKDVPSAGEDTIISIGKYKSTRKKVRVVVAIDQSTGEVSVESWKEEEM